MTHTIDTSDIAALITEEVSRVAAAAYSEDGTSLYDSINILSRDAATVSRLIWDSVDAIVHRTSDICTLIPSPLALSFYAPDMDPSKESAVKDEIDRAISLGACAAWFKEKAPARAEEYLTRANTALDVAVGLLKTRKAPSRI